jgi:transcriptional regulator with AAA-type ATPase domain
MGGEQDTRTISASDDLRAAGEIRPAPCLFLVLEGHRPLAAPARISLATVDEVAFGRAAARAIERSGGPSGRRLAVRIDDPWMSSNHARLTRVLRRWVLEDAGSKNGTLVNGNGAAGSPVELEDGDLIELGHTLLLFREAVPCGPGDPAVLDAAELRVEAPPLATLLPPLAQVFGRVPPIARSVVPVLLEGETGTGKEVLARAVHALSGRPGDLVAINCGALPAALVEGELFGHKKGAFSGATADTPGLVRSADRGTLFLDEIGDLPAPAQAALLRVLQEREVLPIGGTRPVPVDLRVIAATHRSLPKMVEAGSFRADLYARLAGHRLELPPLRARREDLGLLIRALLGRLPPERGGRVKIHPRAGRALLLYDFPGNVRELERALEAALALAEDGRVLPEHLPEALQRSLEAPAVEQASEDAARKEQLVALLREHAGNVTAVARAMGKARMQVQRWMKRYAIDPEGFRR